MRPTGFEPAFSPAGSVGLERSPQGTKTLQSGRYQAVKEETQVSGTSHKISTDLQKLWKPLQRLGSHGFSGFWKIVVKQ